MGGPLRHATRPSPIGGHYLPKTPNWKQQHRKNYMYIYLVVVLETWAGRHATRPPQAADAINLAALIIAKIY